MAFNDEASRGARDTTSSASRFRVLQAKTRNYRLHPSAKRASETVIRDHRSKAEAYRVHTQPWSSRAAAGATNATAAVAAAAAVAADDTAPPPSSHGGGPWAADTAVTREELLASLRAAVAAAIPDPVTAAGVTTVASCGVPRQVGGFRFHIEGRDVAFPVLLVRGAVKEAAACGRERVAGGKPVGPAGGAVRASPPPHPLFLPPLVLSHFGVGGPSRRIDAATQRRQ